MYFSDHEDKLKSDNLSDPPSDNAMKLQQRKYVVNQLDNEVRREYTRFMFDLRDLFTRKRVSMDDALYAFTMYEKADLTSEMREAPDIPSFLSAFSKTQSWYNFETTSFLAEILGGNDGKKLVESYEAKLKVHLKRRGKVVRVKTSKFVVKVNRKEQFTHEEVDQLTITVLRLLKLKQKEVVLKGVKAGCLELTYLLPSDSASILATTIENITPTCEKDLNEHCVISMRIDK